MAAIFLSTMVRAPETKGPKETVSPLSFEVDKDTDVRSIYINIASEVPTREPGKFEEGLSCRIDDSETMDVGTIFRMEQHTFRPSSLKLPKGKHTITFTNKSQFHIKLDIVIDGT
jgi:hypothetical protein